MMALSSDFDLLHTELAEAVIACRAHAGKHAVHAARKATRKMEALLLKALEDHPGAKELHKAAKKAQRELKRVRKAAGPVRDLDVHRDLIEQLRDQAKNAGNAGVKNLNRDCERLDRTLRKKRKQASAKLEKVLKKREVSVESALQETASALTSLSGGSPSFLRTATGWTRRFSPDGLDRGDGAFEDKLHGYRKQTKAARYLAEFQESSASARRLAKRLKEVQDAIGRWHDFLLLTSEAAAVVGKNSALTSLAQAERNSALDAATRSLETHGFT